ncbi:MAG: S-methyl-5-thioribose-1-phosphate isomerase [Halobacteriales archaeon]
MRTIEWSDDRDCVAMIDQTRLPAAHEVYHAETVDQLVESIRRLRVRGAPALGTAGAFGVALATREAPATDPEAHLRSVRELAERVESARPTAVNLARGVQKAFTGVEAAESISERQAVSLRVAKDYADRDVEVNKQLGEHGATLLDDGDTVMTHCNAGALATVDWGTALGLVYSARSAGKAVSVIANETRPLNQGSRLTTWELMERNVPVTLIPDNASGLCLQRDRVDAVVVGADRIVLSGAGEFADGAVFNKIGTYKHAVLADRHEVPFVVAAPTSTIDTDTPTEAVEIEERDPSELRVLNGEANAPVDVPVFNPAFDATPLSLVDYIVTERGVFQPPLDRQLVADA